VRPVDRPPLLSGRTRVLLALLVVQLLFSTLHVVGKIVLAHLEPMALAAVRVTVATPILALWAARTGRGSATRPTARDWRSFALLGLLGVAANQILFLVGLGWTTATSSAILMPSIPVFTAGAAALLGVERLTGRKLAGLAAAVAGAVVLLDPRHLALGGRATLGNLLILANCCCYAFFLVLQRPLLARLPWRGVVAGAFACALPLTLAAAAPAIGRTAWASLPLSTWAGLVYIAVFPTVGAYAINTWAVGRGGPSLSAAATTLQPLLTAGLAAAVLGESLHLVQGLGALMILAGLALVATAAPRAAAAGATRRAAPGPDRPGSPVAPAPGSRRTPPA
jgi:drug/metabolite transporter (DMT)-like permease